MLILPPGHTEAVRRRLTRRERRLARAVAAVVAATVVAIIAALAISGPSSSHGCIYATIPGAVGAQQISECGALARDTCASALRPGEYASQAAGVIAAACRRAGLPVGR